MIPAFLCLCLLIASPLFGGEEDWNEAALIEADEGITITGTRETSQQMKVVTKDEIEKANAPDLAVLLEETAGLSAARYGPYGSQGDINLRGFDAERVAFLIDGIPANSPGSNEFDFNRIDLNSIERIEIMYGGSDSRYNMSGAIGGVINIVTVKKQKPGLHLTGSVSNMSAMPGQYYRPNYGDQKPQWQDLADAQTIRLSAGMGLQNTSWNCNWFGNRAANHFLYQDPYKRTRRKESNEVWDTGLSAALIQDFKNLSKLIVNGSFYWADKNIPINGYSELYDKLYDIASRENIMLDTPRIFRDDLAMEASLSHAMERQDFSDSSPLANTHAVTLINRWAWYLRPPLVLRFNGDYRYSFIETSAFRQRHEGGLSAGLEWSPHKAWTFTPSIKAALYSDGKAVPVPKLGILWKPSESLVIKNNYFRSYKIPDMVDLYWESGTERGNPGLQPEDGWGADIGAAWNGQTESGLRITLDGNAYTQWYDNSIHWYMGSPRNVGGAFFYGADANTGLTMPFKTGPFEKIGLSFSYQFMMSYVLAYGYTFSSNKRIPYMPVHRPGFRAELAWKTGSASIAGYYESPRLTEDFIKMLKPYFFMTAAVNQKVGGNTSVFAAARNILNSNYQSFKDYPMPGITLTLGMSVNLDITAKQKEQHE